MQLVGNKKRILAQTQTQNNLKALRKVYLFLGDSVWAAVRHIKRQSLGDLFFFQFLMFESHTEENFDKNLKKENCADPLNLFLCLILVIVFAKLNFAGECGLIT